MDAANGLYTVVEIVLGIGVIAGGVTVMIANLRSRLPQATIALQNESIAALERQNALLKENVTALNKLVDELRSRVSILETIPLKTIVETLDEIRQIGKANQTLIQAITGNPTINIKN